MKIGKWKCLQPDTQTKVCFVPTVLWQGKNYRITSLPLSVFHVDETPIGPQ